MSLGRLQGGLVVVVLALGGCEPSQIQAGQAILLTALPITVIAFGLHRLYAWLLAPFQDVPGISRRVLISGLAVLIALFVGVFIKGLEPQTDEWLGVAFVAVGSSYATVFAILLRVFIQVRNERLYSWAPLAPWLLYLPSAMVFAFSGSSDEPLGAILLLWIVPGYFGWIGGPCLVVVFLEAALRRYFYHRAQRAEPTPGLPRSIVVRGGWSKRRKQK